MMVGDPVMPTLVSPVMEEEEGTVAAGSVER